MQQIKGRKRAEKQLFQRVDKPSHSLSVLCSGAHECQIRSAPVLVLPRLQRFSITLKRRQGVKIKIILALCQQSERAEKQLFFYFSTKTNIFYCSTAVHSILVQMRLFVKQIDTVHHKK